MKYNLNIILDKESLEFECGYKYQIQKGFENNSFDITILSDKKDKYSDIIKNYQELNIELKKCYKEVDFLDLDQDYLLDYIDKDEEFYKDIFNNINDITIEGSLEETLHFLNNNKELKDKKINISGRYNLDKEKINEIKNTFKDYNNIYIFLEGNTEEVNIDSCIKTIEYIDSIVDKIKRLNLSPLEQLMYAYDLIRDRVYVHENEKESPKISRDLTSVALGEKIVCVGYANIFEQVAKKLGLNSNIYIIDRKNGKSGHAINTVFVQDKKYNKEGLYYFDTTWDSKTKEGDNRFLLGYRFFAKTKEEIEELQEYKYNDRILPEYAPNFANIIKEYINKGGIKNIPVDYIKLINKISSLTDDEVNIPTIISMPNCPLKLNINEKDLIKKLNYYSMLFNNELTADTLLKVLYNVRKNEYYQEPNKYKFSFDDLFVILLNSNWYFDTPESKLLRALLGPIKDMQTKQKINHESMRKFGEKNDLSKKIEQVKLTKTLRNVYEQKKLQK